MLDCPRRLVNCRRVSRSRQMLAPLLLRKGLNSKWSKYNSKPGVKLAQNQGPYLVL